MRRMSYDMLKKYYKSMFHSPLILAIFFILLILSLLVLFPRSGMAAFLLGTNKSQATRFDRFYISFFNLNCASVLLFPLYALYCQYNRIFFQKESVIVRFDDHYLYWKRKIIFLAIDTVIFVLFIHLLIILRFLIFNESKALLDSILCYSLIIPLNIMGFLTFGLTFQFTFAFTGNTAVSFLFSYIFIIYDVAAYNSGWPVTIYPVRTIGIVPENYSANIINLFIMLIALTVLIAVCVSVLAKKDCLIPKEKKDAA